MVLFSIFSFHANSAKAALTFVGTAEGSGTSAAFNVSLTSLTGGSDSAAAAGDLVIVAEGWGGTANGNPGVGTAGYAEVADLHGNDTRDANFSVSWKIMSSTPDTTVSCNGSGTAGNGTACVVHVWRGADQTTTIDVTTTSTTGTNAATINSPSITPSTSGAYVLSLGLGTAAASAGDTSITAPTGYGNQADINGNGTSVSCEVGIASKAWTSGAEDPAAWTNITTSTSYSWGAATVAIRPAFAPTVTTQDESSVTQTTATANGNITATGGISPTVRGFAWGTNSALSGGDTATTTENGTFSTGAFTGSLTSLTCNTTYYTRPYATNSIGTGLGTIDSFTTSSCVSAPTVTTDYSSYQASAATLVGTVTATGGENATQSGFAYGTNSTLSTVIATTTLGSVSGAVPFSGSVGGLSESTTYYYRAYATNSGGTGYGSILSFVTGNSTPSRRIRLLEGFSIKFFDGRIVLYGN